MSRKYRLTALGILFVLLSACGTGTTAGSSGSEATGPSETTGPTGSDNVDGQPVTLTAVTAFGEDNDEQLYGWQAIMEQIASDAPWITIDYRGGPETIPIDQQGEALRDGAIDILITPEAYYSNLMPRILSTNLSPYTPDEERASGAIDVSRRWAEEVLNAYYLGRAGGGEPFKIWLTDPIDELDFSGLNIRVSSLAVPLIRALGGNPIQLPPGDVYTALERGVVDGFAYTESGDISRFGWDEIVRYEINIPYMQAPRTILINLDTWNSLDDVTREVLERIVEENETPSRDETLRIAAEGRTERQADGMQLLNFNDEEEENFLRVAYESTWDLILEQDPAAAEMRTIYEQATQLVPHLGPLEN